MPQNAIETKCVDYILTPTEMPSTIIKKADTVLAGANVTRRLAH
jgi:chemotaxis response regulator CheB